MDMRNLIAEIKDPEQFEEQLLSLDSGFRFKCRHCGKCCKHQDTILFTPRDIYNIAKKLGQTPRQVVNECAEIYIGQSSRIPVVHMVPKGPQRRCPLLRDDGRCSVHDCKPTVCALYPVGRVAVFGKVKDDMIRKEDIRVKYMLNEITCGSTKKSHTIRSWLAQFNIPEEDAFFLLWSEVTANLGMMVRDLEEHKASSDLMEHVWGAIVQGLYTDYDTSKEFMPQFEASAAKLNELSWIFRHMIRSHNGEGPLPEKVAKRLDELKRRQLEVRNDHSA